APALGPFAAARDNGDACFSARPLFVLPRIRQMLDRRRPDLFDALSRLRGRRECAREREARPSCRRRTGERRARRSLELFATTLLDEELRAFSMARRCRWKE